MFEYKTYSVEPKAIKVLGGVIYHPETRSASPIVQYRFGITDLGGGQWSSWEYEKRENIPYIDDKNLAAIETFLQNIYAGYQVIYNSNSSNLTKVRNFNGAEFDAT